MPRTIHKTEEPVTLEGYQAVMKPSKFGYSLSAVVDATVAETLDEERQAYQPWWESKLKNPKRSVEKLEPWEEVAEGKFKIKFSWGEDKRPPVGRPPKSSPSCFPQGVSLRQKSQFL